MAAVDYYQRYCDLAESRGGKLLSPEYLGCDTRLIWSCSEGHEFSMTPSTTKRSWCPTCGWKESGRKRRGDNLRKGREIAAEKGGVCLSMVEGSMTTKVKWRCAVGHVWRTSFATIIHGQSWCPTCARAENGARCIADNLTPARKMAAERGGECLATENFSIHDHVEWMCSMGHRWIAVYYSVRRGRWCSICSSKAMGERKRSDNLSRANDIATRRGGECLATANFTVNDKVDFKCSEGHIWTPAFYNVINGTWCPQCRNKSEEFCATALESLFPTYIFRRHVRDLEWLGVGRGGLPLELDIWCEELRLALEFNGFLHDGPVAAYGGEAHYELIKDHDERKSDACLREEVCLIVIRFSEVSTNQRHIDPKKTATQIWDLVADMGYPQGTHLDGLDELLAALSIE